MKCAACSTELPKGALICGVCGRSVSSKAPIAERAIAAEHETHIEPAPANESWGLPRSGAARPLDSAARQHAAPTPAAPASAAPASGDSAPPAQGDAGERFVLQFSTGESFTVTGTGLVGRNPHPEPGEYFDHSVTIADAAKSVSKTHLEFGQDDGVFWISDRFSGNGTLARDPEGEPRRCDPGKRYRIARGGRVDIGDQFFIVS